MHRLSIQIHDYHYMVDLDSFIDDGTDLYVAYRCHEGCPDHSDDCLQSHEKSVVLVLLSSGICTTYSKGKPSPWSDAARDRDLMLESIRSWIDESMEAW